MDSQKVRATKEKAGWAWGLAIGLVTGHPPENEGGAARRTLAWIDQ